MITKLEERFTDLFQKNMPDAFVFALILTIITGLSAIFWLDVSLLKVLQSWYDGFWILLEFGMQMVLLIITGYSIALSPFIKKLIDRLTQNITSARQVYFFSILIGMLLSLVSWGWIVIAAILARELAQRVKGVHYPYLIACIYFSSNCWATGLSSSIPLLLNTENNYLIEANILNEVIPTSYTLGSTLNISMILLWLVGAPLLMLLLIPKKSEAKELNDLLGSKRDKETQSIAQEAMEQQHATKVVSDQLNNSTILQLAIALLGLAYIVYHFITRGLDLNLNIMIFIFLILGLFLHKTPIRYGISMKRASSNVSGILFQFPFYAGIMGIMTYTGLGEQLAGIIASVATVDSFPFFAYLLGGIVNFAIPSGGGEFAVIGPSVIEAANVLGAHLSPEELIAIKSRASLSIAYGESLTNLLQPFFLLVILPVMGAGIKIQARDIMGYLFVPFLLYFVLQSIMVVWVPL
ncbi:MAG: short-chain fatty acid transporter [Flavobacteriaceae bacterium]